MSFKFTLLSLALLSLAGCAVHKPTVVHNASHGDAATPLVTQVGGDLIIRGQVRLADHGPHLRHRLPHVHVEVFGADGAIAQQWHAPLHVGPTTRRRWTSRAFYSIRQQLDLPADAVVRVHLARDQHDES
jgi:hypothetical protein